MSGKQMMRMMVVGLAMMVVGWVPAMAGSAAIGSLAGSRNATLSGQEAVANTAVFSGDSLHVRDGVAVVAMGQGSRMVFGRETEASFLREGDGVTVLLGGGNVSLYHPQSGGAVAVKAGEVRVEPAAGYKTLGEVAMLNGAVVVTAKEGLLKVEGNGAVKEVAAGKTMTVAARTARAPMPAAPPAGGGIAGSEALEIGALGAGGTAAVLSGIGISRADDAKNAALAANATASEAVSASSASTSAGVAATSAASAATSAAAQANSTANSVGCALDKFENSQLQASTYTPTSPNTCPPGT